MGDGYSDKSVSPLVYQPAADNDPQATGEFFTDAYQKTSEALTTIGASIAPKVPIFFDKCQPSAVIVSACLISDTTAIGLSLTKSYSIDLATGAATEIGSTPYTLLKVMDMKNVGGNLYAICGYTSTAKVIRSTNNGVTWSEVGSATAGLLGMGQISSNSAGTTIIAMYSIGTASFLTLRSTDSGATFAAVTTELPEVVSRLGCITWVSGAIWFGGAGNATSAKFYGLKSTDDGATWTVKSTVTSAPIGITYCNMCYWGNGIATTNGLRTVDNGETWALDSACVGRPHIKMGAVDGVGIMPTSDAFYSTTDALAHTAKFQPSGSNVYALTLQYSTFSQAGGTVMMVTGTANEGVFLMYARINVEHFVTLPSFSVTSPAKLSAILTATAQLVTAGKSGTVKLYLQHTNNAVTTASSLADVAGTWTDCGALTHDTPLSLPSFTARAGEVIYPRLGFTCTDATGVSPAPELSSIAFAWASDVTAPGEPTVTRIVNTSGSSSYGYRVDFGALPAGSRHLIVEGQKNSGGYLPFNTKAQWAAGDHMKLRGSRDAVEEAGERNETSLSSNSGFVKDDTAQVKVAAEDAVGNRSAFVESEVVTMADSEIPFVPVFVDRHSAKVRKRLKAIIRR